MKTEHLYKKQVSSLPVSKTRKRNLMVADYKTDHIEQLASPPKILRQVQRKLTNPKTGKTVEVLVPVYE